jgi:hypothetical protein
MRMLYSVLHGDLLAAVKFNALALVALMLLVVAFAVWTYGRATGRRMWSWQNYRWSAVTTMVVVAVWFVVRNLPFAPFTGLYV